MEIGEPYDDELPAASGDAGSETDEVVLAKRALQEAQRRVPGDSDEALMARVAIARRNLRAALMPDGPQQVLADYELPPDAPS